LIDNASLDYQRFDNWSCNVERMMQQRYPNQYVVTLTSDGDVHAKFLHRVAPLLEVPTLRSYLKCANGTTLIVCSASKV
jgi:hypothetical protein